MQTIEFKSIDEGYFFQCGICNQFPELPVECINCNQSYCYACRPCLYFHEKSGCECQLDTLELFEPFQQYVYSRFSIKCQICQELFQMNQIKKHQIKCQYKLTNQQLLNDNLFNNLNRIQKSPIEVSCISENYQLEPQINKYRNIDRCQKCHLFQFQQSDFQIAKLSEDTIIQLQSIIFQCKICHEEGNIFVMKQHHLFCNQEIITCICGQIMSINV